MEILYVGRVVERLLVVIFAGAAIVMGWHLFYSGIVKDQSAEVQKGQWRLKLLRVGPGVIFALFGAGVLIGSWFSPLAMRYPPLKEEQPSAKTLNANKGAPRKPAEDNYALRYAAGRRDEDLRSSRALNTAIAIAESETTDRNILDAKFVDLKRAVRVLKETRNKIVQSRFPHTAVARWEREGERYKHEPSTFTPDEQETFKELQPWMEETFANER